MSENKIIPINKGNYSLDTEDRDKEFFKNLSLDWEKEYRVYRSKWSEYAKKTICR